MTEVHLGQRKGRELLDLELQHLAQVVLGGKRQGQPAPQHPLSRQDHHRLGRLGIAVGRTTPQRGQHRLALRSQVATKRKAARVGFAGGLLAAQAQLRSGRRCRQQELVIRQRIGLGPAHPRRHHRHQFAPPPTPEALQRGRQLQTAGVRGGEV